VTGGEESQSSLPIFEACRRDVHSTIEYSRSISFEHFNKPSILFHTYSQDDPVRESVYLLEEK
jgi:hypothetical protein